MNTSFYWHFSFWANAGHNISTVTITNKHCCMPSNPNYSSASSCIKQFEILAKIPLCTVSDLFKSWLSASEPIQIFWSTHYCKKPPVLIWLWSQQISFSFCNLYLFICLFQFSEYWFFPPLPRSFLLEHWKMPFAPNVFIWLILFFFVIIISALMRVT